METALKVNDSYHIYKGNSVHRIFVDNPLFYKLTKQFFIKMNENIYC